MIASSPQAHQRILIIDDNRAIHEDFRKILGQPSAADLALQAAEAQLFGTSQAVWFEIDTASQGAEGLKMVEQAIADGRPYSLAFVDVRMPPGIDGIETTRQIWQVCPDLQIVICTAFSDCSWNEMQEQINPMDRLLILKKPFDTIEVLQLANALTEKWRLLQESKTKLGDLDQMVKQRTQELEESQLAALTMMQEAVSNRQNIERAYEELTRETNERRKLAKQHREQASLLDKAR
ncbi:MAG: response regulator receiver sensor hybrid histidine kinase, partial [Prosthecobacter sp.]|nr:response regulator receiver sensor hybrid histidine kinase [Prosthecobacter sp.]